MQDDVRLQQLADLSRRRGQAVDIARLDENVLGQDEADLRRLIAAVIGELVFDEDVLDLAVLGLEAAGGKKLRHRRLRRLEALAGFHESRSGGDEAHRPEPEIGLDVALGEALDRDDAHAEPALDQLRPPQPSGGGDASGQHRRGK